MGNQKEEWVTQKACAAYNYCINGLQELLPNSDVERMLEDSGLILAGGFKMTGGFLLTLAGAATSYTGIGFGGVAAGTVTGVAGISDIEQGINELKLGWKNDSTTQTGNYVRDTLFGGNGIETICYAEEEPCVGRRGAEEYSAEGGYGSG